MKQLVIVSGYSGAGKSVALNALEDIGYQAIDNIPLKALPSVVAAIDDEVDYIALGSDIRSQGFSAEELIGMVDALRKETPASLLFLSCETDVLLGRFKETRRPHPLAKEGAAADGIESERLLLEPIRTAADYVFDTTELIPRELQRMVQQRFAAGEIPFHIEILSFSYKQGIPRGSDLVFDVRFLKNPHYVAELKPQTGLDQAVGEYIASDERCPKLLDALGGLLSLTLPFYKDEGKYMMTIAVGCTGGKHRSVYVAEQLASRCRNEGYVVSIRHRDMQAKAAAA